MGAQHVDMHWLPRAMTCAWQHPDKAGRVWLVQGVGKAGESGEEEERKGRGRVEGYGWASLRREVVPALPASLVVPHPRHLVLKVSCSDLCPQFWHRRVKCPPPIWQLLQYTG